MKTRIYCVSLSSAMQAVLPHVETTPRLVRASSRAQAERHVAKDLVASRVASQEDLVEYLENGLETVGDEYDASADTEPLTVEDEAAAREATAMEMEETPA